MFFFKKLDKSYNVWHYTITVEGHLGESWEGGHWMKRLKKEKLTKGERIGIALEIIAIILAIIDMLHHW